MRAGVIMTTMEWITLTAALLSGVGGAALAIGVMRGQIQSLQREREQDRREIHAHYIELQRRIDALVAGNGRQRPPNSP